MFDHQPQGKSAAAGAQGENQALRSSAAGMMGNFFSLKVWLDQHRSTIDTWGGGGGEEDEEEGEGGGGGGGKEGEEEERDLCRDYGTCKILKKLS